MANWLSSYFKTQSELKFNCVICGSSLPIAFNAIGKELPLITQLNPNILSQLETIALAKSRVKSILQAKHLTQIL